MQQYSRQKSVLVRPSDSDEVIAESTLSDSVHEIKVEIAFSLSRSEIKAVKAAFIRYPWNICPQAARVMVRLVGLSLRPGMGSTIRELVGKNDGCTNLADLTMEALAGIIQFRLRMKYYSLNPNERKKASHDDLKGNCLAFSCGDTLKVPTDHWVSEKWY
ncbi:MAG: DUF2889 domain-containing protein [Firmicutes bacterium]|nr:DUF2889 domain-containing protein [Bacillota bacterium]